MVDRARRDRDQSFAGLTLSRQALPEVFEKVLTAGDVNTVVVEIPYRSRVSGAVQVYATDGGSVTATVVVEGSLMDDSQRWEDIPGSNPTVGRYIFLVPSEDSDYDSTALLTFTNVKGIKELTFGNRYGRIRVRLTALTGTNVGLRVL